MEKQYLQVGGIQKVIHSYIGWRLIDKNWYYFYSDGIWLRIQLLMDII